MSTCRGRRCGEGIPYESGDGGGGGPSRAHPESNVDEFLKRHGRIPRGMEIVVGSVDEDWRLGREFLEHRGWYIRGYLRVGDSEPQQITDIQQSAVGNKVKVHTGRSHLLMPYLSGIYPYKLQLVKRYRSKS